MRGFTALDKLNSARENARITRPFPCVIHRFLDPRDCPDHG